MTISGFDDSAEDIIYEGPVSIVTRIQPADASAQCLAVKSSTTNKKYAKEPHDIIREARLIASASHSNIIPLIKREFVERSQTLNLWMPYVPFSLSDLLSSPTFSPRPLVSFDNAPSSPLIVTPRERRFVVLAKSILYQILSGTAYLHQTARIAHRDIKPSNVRITASGYVQLIDFGVAMKVDESVGDGDEAKDDLWPESAEKMHFQVSTGSYRAPELLFGPQSYDAFAIDAWSLGTTFAEFFTPLRLRSDEDHDHATSESESDSATDSDTTTPLEPFIIPQTVRPTDPSARWTRDSLFDGDRGEIGLAWSIFKVRGSPDEHNWPSFHTLPDAGKVSFVDVEPTDLALLLPNLPPSTVVGTGVVDTKTHLPLLGTTSSSIYSTPLDLLHRFLVYEPARRLRPSDALHHPWFMAPDERQLGVLLPEGYVVPSAPSTFMFKWENKTLGELVRAILSR